MSSGAGPSAAVPGAVNLDKHPSGIVPVLQNVVSTVNLGCKLDLKEIALHARNAEYNPKVQGCREGRALHAGMLVLTDTPCAIAPPPFTCSLPALCSTALCCCHHAHSGAQDHGPHLCIRKDGGWPLRFFPVKLLCARLRYEINTEAALQTPVAPCRCAREPSQRRTQGQQHERWG